jgi:hypothetical protein
MFTYKASGFFKNRFILFLSCARAVHARAIIILFGFHNPHAFMACGPSFRFVRADGYIA